jgi:hypothetical protein
VLSKSEVLRLLWDPEIDTIPVPENPESATEFKALRAAVVAHIAGTMQQGNLVQHRELADELRSNHVQAVAHRELLLRRTKPEVPAGRERHERELQDANQCADAYRRLLAVITSRCASTCLTIS